MASQNLSLAPAGVPSPAAVLEVLKPITWFPPMWAMLCGVVASAQPLTGQVWLVVAGMVLAGPLLCAASQVVNDWFDREVDAINEPQRPIPSGRLPGAWGLGIAIFWSLLSIGFALLLGPWVAAASLLGLVLAWAYSAPPLRLKENGWLSCTVCALCYEGLPWITGSTLFEPGSAPGARTLACALLFSTGAIGIMMLNDFKSIDGDRAMGLRSIPVQIGAPRAARLACGVMAAPQALMVALLCAWSQMLQAGVVLALLVVQCLLMRRWLRQPRELAPWYNATGVTLYVLGMMTTAYALRVGATS